MLSRLIPDDLKQALGIEENYSSRIIEDAFGCGFSIREVLCYSLYDFCSFYENLMKYYSVVLMASIGNSHLSTASRLSYLEPEGNNGV